MTLTQYRDMLLARQRTLLEGDPHSDFRGLPQLEIDGRLAELRNALNMLDCVEVPTEETPESLFAISLAPDWGMSCPHCQARLYVEPTTQPLVCQFCQGLYRQPAGALTVAEARRRPTEANSGR